MTSVDGGEGSPKNIRKEQNQLICDGDKGGGGKKSRKFCGRHIWKPPILTDEDFVGEKNLSRHFD